MSTRYLESLFNPASIAIIGASERSLNLGGIVLRNIMASEYEGKLVIVNDKGYADVHGVPCVRRASLLPFKPDLAIVCTPPASVPMIVRQLGQQSVRMVMILTGGLSRTHSRSGRSLMHAVQEIAEEYNVRILGPETMGIMVPQKQLNATYAHMGVLPGKVAYIGQSGTLASAVIDWALHRGIGFSYLTTLGDGIDIDQADLIDYFAQDHRTRAILLHMENISSPSRFISAVRAVSRSKPVIAVKSARSSVAQWVPQELPLGITDIDKIYDAVLRRAGVLRVNGSDEMFDALETITRMKRVQKDPLHIITNGLGPGVLAIDRLESLDGELGTLAPETVSELAKVLPPYWTRKNPIDLNYNAGPELYEKVLEILSRDVHVGNVLVMYAPSLTEDSLQVADAVINFADRSHLNIFSCWLGHATVQDAREEFIARGIPHYTTPDKAVKAFMHMVRHQRSQRVLRETPESFTDPNVDPTRLYRHLEEIRHHRDRRLTRDDVLSILEKYHIPWLKTYQCKGEEEVVAKAIELGGAVDIKIIESHIKLPFRYHTPAWRNKALRDVNGEASVRDACRYLQHHFANIMPDSEFPGFEVQKHISIVNPISFSIGITRDPTFGPLIVCGASGAAMTEISDRRVALPPLNIVLARDLLLQTYMAKMLRNSSEHEERDINLLSSMLVKISQIVIDLPQVKHLELSPVLISRDGPVVGMASCELGDPATSVIHPYPRELTEWVILPRSRRKVELRPVRGEDEPAHIAFFDKLSPESIRLRFFQYRKSFSHDELVQMLQIDYDREMAFIAVAHDNEEGVPETLGAVRTWTDADNLQCEFAVIVQDSLKGERLGFVLMRKIIEYNTDRGTIEMYGLVLPENQAMLSLARKLGFSSRFLEEEDAIEVRLRLNEPDEWQAERLAKKR